MFSDEEWQNLTMAKDKFKIIKFDHNKISRIDMMPEYPVEYVELSHNQITDIANGAFGNFKNLTLLNLSHNKLKSEKLTAHTFKGVYDPNNYQPMKELYEINLSFNELHNINADLFQHFPNLGVLILSGNNLNIIDLATEQAITTLTQLEVN